MLSVTVRRAEFSCAYEPRSFITKNLRWAVSWETYVHSFHSMSTTSFSIILKPTRGPFGSGLLCCDKWPNFTDALTVRSSSSSSSSTPSPPGLSRGGSLKSHGKYISYSPYACFMPIPYNPLLRGSREPILLTWSVKKEYQQDATILHLVGILSSRFSHDARSQEHKA